MNGECNQHGLYPVDCHCAKCEIDYKAAENRFSCCFPPLRDASLPESSVNHPEHYQGNTLEVIDIIEDFNLNFCLGNAIKYILRAGKKENRLEDLKKAIWYLERECQAE